MPLLDRMRDLMKGITTRTPDEPEPEVEHLYSPPERGSADPDPSHFNVGNVVRAAGTNQAGAPAQFDERRRPLRAPVLVSDGTRGVVRGVDLDLLFVEVAVRTPLHNWRKKDPTELAFQAGDRVVATGPIQMLDQQGVVPNKSNGTVSAAYDDTMDVQVMFQFNKDDWLNPTDMGRRVWGQRLVEVGAVIEVAANRKHTAGDEPARGATHWNGIPIHIEHFAGDVRHPEGPHPSYVPHHYGYIPDTEATDGDAVDIILGNHENHDMVYLGVQKHHTTGEFEQFKVMLDFEDSADAEAAMRMMWPDFMVGEVLGIPTHTFIATVLPKLDVTGMVEVT